MGKLDLFDKVMIVFLIIIMFGIPILAHFEIENIQGPTLVKCYDNENNEILGIDCIDEGDNKLHIISLAILTEVYCLVGLGILFYLRI